MLELCIYLSYYKDIIFATEICLFYLGIFYNQVEFPKVKAWGEWLFAISIIFIAITLLHNFKSAFYTKYTYYVAKLEEVNESNVTDEFIKRDVKFWLKDSADQHLYHTEKNKNRKSNHLDKTKYSTDAEP